ncbi:MAG: ATP-binding cassette domain-containing protein [Deltaproteobacteria bacterium]|nr:ATP-binding cassette domain-containing protein [Deltaproteobacteria bacterium]
MALLDADFTLHVGGFDLAVTLQLESGVLVLFGPSGAGKSLTVSALAGLVTPSSGRIRLGGETLFDRAASVDVPTRHRHVGYVPQHHSLFPFCSVAENVAFGLPRERRRRDDPRVVELLEELELTHLADARPGSLSGGERQRVAFARALAVQPQLLLLDEPFASIDRAGRARVRSVLRRVLRRHRTPAVLVTHDPAEALELGDHLVRFERGRTIDAGTPEALLRQPEIVLHGRLETGADGAQHLHDVRVKAPAGALVAGPDGQVTLRVPVPPPDETSGR